MTNILPSKRWILTEMDLYFKANIAYAFKSAMKIFIQRPGHKNLYKKTDAHKKILNSDYTFFRSIVGWVRRANCRLMKRVGRLGAS